MANPKQIGRYRIEHELGRGGMGVVYAAWDDQLERRVAIKTIAEGISDKKARKRLQREARAAGRISLQRFVRLADAVKVLLSAAIEQGGTTLRDFVGSDGQPGYFAQQLNVYGRAGLACRQCTSTLRELRQSNRSSVYCPGCQR